MSNSESTLFPLSHRSLNISHSVVEIQFKHKMFSSLDLGRWRAWNDFLGCQDRWVSVAVENILDILKVLRMQCVNHMRLI